MRNTLLITVAAAFVLSSVAAAPLAAGAGPTTAQLKKDSEIKDPAAANAAVTKDEAKDARKRAHIAHKKAQLAARKAKAAARSAAKARA